MNDGLKISAPWILYYKAIEALFAKDQAVKTAYDDENKVIKLYVDGDRKAEALAQLLPKEKNFGDVIVKIEVIPANEMKTQADLFKAAFEGNGAFAYIAKNTDPLLGNAYYLVFRKKVVQYWGDNLNDIKGNISTLFEDIARTVFEDSEVFFCTESDLSVSW